MAIQIKIMKKLIGNRKKYRSLEEMPDDIRQAIEKTIMGGDPNTQSDTETKIIVNGKEYDSIEQVPPDIREVYVRAIKALKTSKATDEEFSLSGEGMSRGKHPKMAISYRGPGPIEPETSFSSFRRGLIIGAVSVAVIAGLYFLIHSKIVPSVLQFLKPSGGYVYLYRDADGDGRGNPGERILGKRGEEPPIGYTVVVGDCDDHDPNK